MLHVGLVPVCHVHVAPPADPALVLVIEVLDAVQVVKVPECRGVLAIDLERVERLVPARVARRLEGRGRAVLEAAEKCARVIDPDRLDLAGE